MQHLQNLLTKKKDCASLRKQLYDVSRDETIPLSCEQRGVLNYFANTPTNGALDFNLLMKTIHSSATFGSAQHQQPYSHHYLFDDIEPIIYENTRVGKFIWYFLHYDDDTDAQSSVIGGKRTRVDPEDYDSLESAQNAITEFTKGMSDPLGGNEYWLRIAVVDWANRHETDRHNRHNRCEVDLIKVRDLYYAIVWGTELRDVEYYEDLARRKIPSLVPFWVARGKLQNGIKYAGFLVNTGSRNVENLQGELRNLLC